MLKNERWEQFWGSKKRTTRTWYSQGRLCKKCLSPITDTNESGYCASCFKGSHLRQGESSEHRDLKIKARIFLEALGCVGIKNESEFRGMRFDAIGYKDGKTIIIECGGSQERKLLKISKLTEFLYVWPYNYDKPFIYDPHMKICHICGNHLNNVKSL